MWDEGAEVISDGAEGFADAEAAAVLVDHPETEDGVAVVEDGRRCEGLDDLQAVVGAFGGDDCGVVADEGDVGSFAGDKGFADVVFEGGWRWCVFVGEVGFEEEVVVGVELPEDGEDAFVGEKHLPDGLDPADVGVGVEGLRAELFVEHGLPGVELEDGEDGMVVEVDEGLLLVVPADVLHQELAGVQAGLLGGVAEVGNGEVVFGVVFVFEGGEVDGFGEVRVDVAPLGDEFFVDGVELVGFGGDEGGGHGFEPVPLDDGGFEEGGGGVGVVLEELGRLAAGGAGPADVEAAVEGRRLVVPGPLDGFDGEFGDVEFGVTASRR